MQECAYCGKMLTLESDGPLFCNVECEKAKAEEETCSVSIMDFVEHDFA